MVSAVAIKEDGEVAAAYAIALLEAIARDEIGGRRPPRLTEPGQAT